MLILHTQSQVILFFETQQPAFDSFWHLYQWEPITKGFPNISPAPEFPEMP